MSHDFRISQEKVQKNGRRHAERRILMTSFQFDVKTGDFEKILSN